MAYFENGVVFRKWGIFGAREARDGTLLWGFAVALHCRSRSGWLGLGWGILGAKGLLKYVSQYGL